MKELAKILVPHKKLTGLYILALLLIGGLWPLDLSKLNVPLSTKLETWFLDKLLITLTMLLVLYSLSTYLLVYFHKKDPAKANPTPHQNQESNEEHQTQEEIMLKQIILHILKLRGANEPATPKRIAGVMGQDTGIVFAHMCKLHNDQYMTFQTGGAMPTVDTDFFLSPKAYDIVKLESA